MPGKYLKINLIIAVIIAILVGLTFAAIGLSHNSQGEFYIAGTDTIDIRYVSMIFFSWFIPSFVVCMSIGLLIMLGMLLFSCIRVKFRLKSNR